MFNLNATLNDTIPVSMRLEASELIKDFCTQLDSRILLGVMLICSFYVFGKIVIPRAKMEYKKMAQKFSLTGGETVLFIFDEIVSALETGGLVASGFIIYIFIYQEKITTFYWCWLGFLLALIGLTAIAHFIGYIRKGKLKEDLKKSKERIKEIRKDGGENGK